MSPPLTTTVSKQNPAKHGESKPGKLNAGKATAANSDGKPQNKTRKANSAPLTNKTKDLHSKPAATADNPAATKSNKTVTASTAVKVVPKTTREENAMNLKASALTLTKKVSFKPDNEAVTSAPGPATPDVSPRRYHSFMPRCKLNQISKPCLQPTVPAEEQRVPPPYPEPEARRDPSLPESASLVHRRVLLPYPQTGRQVRDRVVRPLSLRVQVRAGDPACGEAGGQHQAGAAPVLGGERQPRHQPAGPGRHGDCGVWRQ